MKVKVNTEWKYVGKESTDRESFYIEIESEVDSPESVVKKYLELRKALMKGLTQKEDK